MVSKILNLGILPLQDPLSWHSTSILVPCSRAVSGHALCSRLNAHLPLKFAC